MLSIRLIEEFMINSVSSPNAKTSFKGIVTVKKGGKLLEGLDPIITTPSEDTDIIEILRGHGIRLKAKLLKVVSLDTEKDPSFKKLMQLMHIPADLFESAWSCTVEKIRPQAVEDSTKPVIHNVKVTIDSTKTFFLDLNQKPQGLRKLKPEFEIII